MKTKSFVVLLDTLFATVIAFILLFVFISFFTYPPYSLILSATLSLLFALLLYKFFNTKYSGKLLKKRDKENVDKLFNHLGLLKKSEVLSLFESAFINLNYAVNRRNGVLRLPDKKQVYFLDFSFDGITKSTVVKAYNAITQKETAVIYCAEASGDVLAFLKRFDGKIKIAEKEEIYKLLENANSLPKIETPIKPKRQVKEIAMEFFTKKRAKSYFTFGSTFLFLSFFVTFKIYYIVVGCIFLTLSMCCLFFKPEPKS